ncbi:hypothetical protein DF185_04275 [Marinifilum breve]|uniref:Uncharacterized protein n=1 Tax=Marinifilum breve TaxID=2184082 RepID=A0A2V3ZZF3_9BACT|nr:hypothetical protein [Marinifilum breve]PXY01872.1 hypothetical protein DF185_04275 [Marinifilum breve]
MLSKMKEKPIFILLVSLLLMLATALNSIDIQQDTSLSFNVENSSDSQDTSSDLEEMDSEDLDEFSKFTYAFFANVILQEHFQDYQISDTKIFQLTTPPPQV